MSTRLTRRSLVAVCSLLALAGSVAAPDALAQSSKDSLVLAMTLEPPGLDPTAGAASAIGEVTLYNIFETLTKINSDSKITPLLAESWTISPDLKTYSFKLRPGVRFHNGEMFSSQTVKFSLERAAAKDSTNKDKAVFANIERIDTPDEDTVVLNLKNGNPDLLFQLGQHCEKAGDWPQAQQIYAACRYPGARARAIRVLEIEVGSRRLVAFVDGTNGAIEPRVVRAQARGEEELLVRDGVKEGERVVTRALFLVDAESQLKAVVANMSGTSTD